MSALSALLGSLIDYAGLFPPAGLAMTEAVRNHEAYLHGPHAACLGRFIVPAARLAEFEIEFGKLAASTPRSWQLSVLAGTDRVADATAIEAFNARHSQVRIVSVEAKASNPADVARLVTTFSPETEVWIEVPAAGDVSPFVSAIQSAGRRTAPAGAVGAKIRTGGITPEAFPSTAEVARFLQACRAARVIFKATAGLHHPVRGAFPLTYQAGSPHGLMFGFLNLFLAATLIHTDGSGIETVALLEECDAKNFTLSSDAIAWREHRFTTARLAAARKSFCRSFGSCSFTEPIDGLQSLHWL